MQRHSIDLRNGPSRAPHGRGLVWILLILGTACATQRIPSNALHPRPIPRPTMTDNSPRPCPECPARNGQDMWSFTERDFIAVKMKLVELDDYIQYLLELMP